jgi:tetratricopeptide (TPR) repeat protein
MTALQAKDFDTALKLLNAIIDTNPGFTEAYNRRGAVYFAKGMYQDAAANIAVVLKREPKHFEALAGLGQILDALGKKEEALEMFQRALDVYPQMEQVPEAVKNLQGQLYRSI